MLIKKCRDVTVQALINCHEKYKQNTVKIMGDT